MPELLLELLSEEIPARMQARAAADLGRLVGGALDEARLPCASVDTYVTPRRLTLVADGLPARQPDVREERKGPRVDAPEKAISGFLRSVGLDRDQVEERETGKGVFLFAVTARAERDTPEVLADILPDALRRLPWPKSMRWGGRSLRWVRPLHRILCLFDGATVGFALEDIVSGDTTVGHRFLAPRPFAVTGFADYAGQAAAGARRPGSRGAAPDDRRGRREARCARRLEGRPPTRHFSMKSRDWSNGRCR